MKYIKSHLAFILESNNNEIDESVLEKAIKRAGKRFVIYRNIKINIISERGHFGDMEIWVGDIGYGGLMGRDLISYNKRFSDLYDTIDELKELIMEKYDDLFYSIERTKEAIDKIKNGSKYINLGNIKSLLLYAIPNGYIGRNHIAMSGSSYIYIYGKEIRFSDHTRPPTSKWNYIHGDNYHEARTGYMNKEELYKYVDNLLKGEITDGIKERIDYYFDNKIDDSIIPDLDEIMKKYQI